MNLFEGKGIKYYRNVQEQSTLFVVEKSHMDPDKRELRKLKRQIKKAGNKRRRQYLKRELHDNPEGAHHGEYDFGRYSSEAMNGMDQDNTRKKKGD